MAICDSTKTVCRECGKLVKPCKYKVCKYEGKKCIFVISVLCDECDKAGKGRYEKDGITYKFVSSGNHFVEQEVIDGIEIKKGDRVVHSNMGEGEVLIVFTSLSMTSDGSIIRCNIRFNNPTAYMEKWAQKHGIELLDKDEPRTVDIRELKKVI